MFGMSNVPIVEKKQCELLSQGKYNVKTVDTDKLKEKNYEK